MNNNIYQTLQPVTIGKKPETVQTSMSSNEPAAARLKHNFLRRGLVFVPSGVPTGGARSLTRQTPREGNRPLVQPAVPSDVFKGVAGFDGRGGYHGTGGHGGDQLPRDDATKR